MLSACLVIGICQASKCIGGIIRDRKLVLKNCLRDLTKSGGMPSSHSAFVSALTFSIGYQKGFTSEIFALSAVFTSIVIHDAVRVRGAVGRLEQTLNRLIVNENRDIPQLPEDLGHTELETLVGVIFGSVGGLLFTLLLNNLILRFFTE